MILSQSGDADFARHRHSLKRFPFGKEGTEGRDDDRCAVSAFDKLLEDSPLIKGVEEVVAVSDTCRGKLPKVFGIALY